MKRPEEVIRSRDEGEALLARLERDALTAEDRRVLAKGLTFYFWLLFALRAAKLSLKRLKILVFGEKPKKRPPPESGGHAGGGGGRGTEPQVRKDAEGHEPAEDSSRRPGHGRAGAVVSVTAGH